MTVTNHTLAGVGMAAAVPNPWLGLPLAFISHLVMDVVPHFGMENTDEAQDGTVISSVVIDTVLALAVVGTAIQADLAAVWYLLLATLAAVLPDILHPIRYLGGYELLPRFQTFHDRIQWAEAPTYIWIDILMAITLASLVLF